MSNFYKTEDPDPEDWTPHHSEHKTRICRGCSGVLAHGDAINWFNGWPWHAEPCYREIVALYLNQPQPVTDEDALEHFRQRTSR